MNTLALSILWALVRTGLVLSLSAVAVAAFLRLFQVASPTVRRTAYVAVLLQGWLFFESPFALPLPASALKVVGWVGWDQFDKASAGPPASQRRENSERKEVETNGRPVDWSLFSFRRSTLLLGTTGGSFGPPVSSARDRRSIPTTEFV